MKIRIPESLRLEHEELHNQLSRAIKSEGKTAEAANHIAVTLHPHFVAAEEFAIPPLGVLQLLAENKINDEMREVIIMTDKLKTELPRMLEEHKAIVASLDTLIEKANEEGKPEFVAFAEKLKLHARTEEEVMYPAALLIGEYLKLKLN